ncbi:MAG: hypothetical protein J6P82_01445 [Bacteroidales bacterium]|nr:hypothetical protein [Bacteroidales bacterium]
MKEIEDNEIRNIGQSQSGGHLNPQKLQTSPDTFDIPDSETGSENDSILVSWTDPTEDIFQQKRKRRFLKEGIRITWIGILIIVSIIAVLLYIIFRQSEKMEYIEQDAIGIETPYSANLQLNSHRIASDFAKKYLNTNSSDENEVIYCNINRITANNIPLKIFNPGNAVPELHVGEIEASDNNIILAFQAADIRKDNGGIVGTFIRNGEIISKGVSKAGFVAIINGEIKIGAELNSPYFEEAIQTNGSFFRQYALIKDGLILESNLKEKSIRRAICEQNGKIFIAETCERASMQEFSQALISQGVKNAVYLVGSSKAHGFARQDAETFTEWGDPTTYNQKNITYLVWKNNNR